MKKLFCPHQGEINIPDNEQVLLIDRVDAIEKVQALKIIVGRNCRVDYIFIVNYNSVKDIQGSREVDIGAGSIFNASQLYLQVGKSSWVFNNNFAQEILFNQRVLIYGQNEEVLRVDEKLTLGAPGTKIELCVDGVLDEAARLDYFSELNIEAAAQKSDTRIDMKLYNFGDQARGTILPALKIAANEVKAGHGAGTFSLSDDDLFYLNSRGLLVADMRILFKETLLSSFLNRIKDGDLKQEISDLSKNYLFN